MWQREKELVQQVVAVKKADAAEDTLKQGDELPTELQRAETRLARIRAARAELDAEQCGP